jgi:hypothetical protein
MIDNSSTRKKEGGQQARSAHRLFALFTVVVTLAVGGTAVFLRHQAKASTGSATIVPSKPMQGCLVLLAGTVGTNFHIPSGLSEDGSGALIVSDSYNNLIRKISGDGSVSTIAGNGEYALKNGAARAASFEHPVAVAAGLHGEYTSPIPPIM